MNDIDLRGRCAIVTGAARGIGLATVERFLASGARVAMWDRDGEELTKAAESLSGKGEVVTRTVDVSDAGSVGQAAADAKEALGKIDILLNSAGVAGHNATIWETEIEEWRRVIEINLNGVFYCCHSVVPYMIENGYGRIVNIASVAGKEGNPNAAHYSASKAGVIGMTKSLGKELVDKNIICNAITPAVIDTPIIAQSTQAHLDYMIGKIPLGRLGRAEEVAALIAWLSSEDCSFSTGATFDISGGRATY